MLKLAENDARGRITIVEEPKDVVSRLGRLNPSGSSMVASLADLGPEFLRSLATQTERALERFGGNGNGTAEPKRQTESRTFTRPRTFGD